MGKLSTLFVGMVKAVISTYQTSKFMTGTFTNIKANGYSLDSINIISPYGTGSYPVQGIKGLLIPIENSSKSSYNCVGFGQTLPPIPYTPLEGESWKFSKKYVMLWKNNSIMAYRVSDDSYSATLPSGEWFSKICLDLINDNNQTLRNYINQQINLFLRTHTHAGVATGGGTSGISAMTINDIQINNTLNDDRTAINNQKVLINDNGTKP